MDPHEIPGSYRTLSWTPSFTCFLLNIPHNRIACKIIWLTWCCEPRHRWICGLLSHSGAHLLPIWLSTNCWVFIFLANAPAMAGTEWPLERAFLRTSSAERRDSLPDGSASREICESVASWTSKDGDGFRHKGVIGEGSWVSPRRTNFREGYWTSENT